MVSWCPLCLSISCLSELGQPELHVRLLGQGVGVELGGGVLPVEQEYRHMPQ